MFVLALIGGVILGVAGNVARRLKNNGLVILIGAGAALTFITLMLSSSYPDWSSLGYPFLLGLVIGTLVPVRTPSTLNNPSSQ